MCISQDRSRHVFLDIAYLHVLVHRLFRPEKQAENPYACTHVYFPIMLRHPMDTQCLHVHLSISLAGENRQKAEGVDIYASISFKNAKRRKNCCIILCADRVANTNPH